MHLSFHIGWPQGIILGLWAIGLAVNGLRHGKVAPMRLYDFPSTVTAQILVALLLYWGGFFG